MRQFGYSDIEHGVTNHITMKDARKIKVKDLYRIAKADEETNFLICDKVEEGMYSLYSPSEPLNMHLRGMIQKENKSICFNLVSSAARKYQERPVDIEIFHEALGEEMIKKDLIHDTDHDMPAFYLTTGTGYLTSFKDEDTLDKVIVYVRTIANDIYERAIERAIHKQINELNFLLNYQVKKYREARGE